MTHLAAVICVLVAVVASVEAAVVTERTTSDGAFTVSSTDLLQTSLDSMDSSDLDYSEAVWAAPLASLHDGLFVAGSTDSAFIVKGTNVFLLDTNSVPEGYQVAQIDTFSGNGDQNRVIQSYTVSYATVDAPSTYTDIATIVWGTKGHLSEKWSITDDSASGIIASNVCAIRFVFPLQEYSGGQYKEIDIIAPGPETTRVNTWSGFSVSSTDLLQTSLDSVTDAIDYRALHLGSVTDDPNLKDGLFNGGDGSGTNGVGIEGGTITYTLDTSVNYNGYDISSVETYCGWADFNRTTQYYIFSYSTVDAPSTFTELFTCSQTDIGGTSEKVTTTNWPSGYLAQNVKAVRFDFGDSTQQQFDGVCYKELDVIGTGSYRPKGTVITVR